MLVLMLAALASRSVCPDAPASSRVLHLLQQCRLQLLHTGQHLQQQQYHVSAVLQQHDLKLPTQAHDISDT